MRPALLRTGIMMLLFSPLLCGYGLGQFLDDFNGTSVRIDSEGINGWHFQPGDGTATMDFHQGGKGYAGTPSA